MARVNGETEIYISHQHMVEQVSSDGSTSKWVYGKEDQGLNAAMLARLMVFLGTSQQQAQTLIAQAAKQPNQPKITTPDTEKAEQTITEPIDRAWRRGGRALDTAAISADDRER